MITCGDTSIVLRWSVILLQSLATGGMALVSMRANYLFGYGFGQTPERAVIFGWANVAADIWKMAGLLVIASLWRERRRRYALMLVPIWLTCLLWGIAGAIGVYAQDRTALVGSRELTASALKDAQRDLREIEATLAALHATRSVAQIDAAIATVLARPVTVLDRVRGTVGKLSGNCSREDRATAEACAEVASLREERAAVEHAVKLKEDRAALQAKIDRLERSGGALPVDPVADFFAWLSRGQISVRDLSFGFPLVFALLIELVTALGPAGIAAYADATGRAAAGHGGSRRAASGSVPLRPVEVGHGLIIDWMAERTEPTIDAAGIAVETLHTDYETWCRIRNEPSLLLESFVVELDRLRALPELDDKIQKMDGRYYGLRLVRPRLLARR
jgi:hypothetical protein